MRIFAGDVIPNLALVASALPRPWVLPNGLSRKHRNRLIRVLHAALQGARPALRLGEIRWGERDLVASGRIKLPAAVLIRWRMDPWPGVDRRAVMREAHRICPDLSVFDFGPIAGEEALAWLGPLKMEVLHRLIDVLMDDKPVERADALAEHLQDLARFVRSPVHLIDGAETMVEQVMLGQTARSARAEASARIIAAHFDDEPADRDAADIIRALVQVSGQAAGQVAGQISDDTALTRASRALLERVGLMEPGVERPLPVADLLCQEDVMPRAQRLVVARFPLRERIPELQLDVPVAGDLMASPLAPIALQGIMPSRPIEPRIAPSVEADDLDGLPAPSSSKLRAARKRYLANDVQGAARLVLEQIQTGHASKWSPEDATVAGSILLWAAHRLEETIESTSAPEFAVVSAWFEASADAFLLADTKDISANVLFAAGMAARNDRDLSRAEALLERSLSLVSEHDEKQLVAEAWLALGNVKERMGQTAAARDAYHAALDLFHDLQDAPRRAHTLLALGSLHANQNELQEAHVAFEEALPLYQRISDNDGQSAALVWLGALNLFMTRLEEANEQLTEALTLYPEEDTAGKGWIHLSLGMLRMATDDWNEARRELEQALALFQESGQSQGYSQTLDALGKLQLQLHDLVGARSTYEAMLAASRSSKNEAGQAEGLIGMGHALRRLSNLDGARACCERALHLARNIEDHGIEANALRSLGDLEVWIGDLATSQTLYEQALSLSQETQNPLSHFRPLLGAASIRTARGQDAAMLVEECVRLTESIGIRFSREYCRLLEAALLWPTEPGEARRIWADVADYLRQSRRRAMAALASALVAVAETRPLAQIAQDLEETLGTTHPLPGRVRQAGDPDTAIRTIIAFLAA